MRGCTVPFPHARTHRQQNVDRPVLFAVPLWLCTHRRHGFQCCPGSHPYSRSPAFQNSGTHPSMEREIPKVPEPGCRSTPVPPLPSRCPRGWCTHRHGLRLLPGAGFSASPGTCPVQQSSFHKGLYSDRWYSCYRTSSCCFGFLSVLRGCTGRFRLSSTEGRVLLATTDSVCACPFPSMLSRVSNSTRRAFLLVSSSS